MEKPLESLNDIDSLEQYITSKQKELQGAISDRETVESERYNLTREILSLQLGAKEKQIKKIELDKSLAKARANCTMLNIEIKRATQKFWSVKNG